MPLPYHYNHHLPTISRQDMAGLAGVAVPGAAAPPKQLVFRAGRLGGCKPAAAKHLSRRRNNMTVSRELVVSLAAPVASPPGAAKFEGLQGFDDRSASEFNIAVLGDLHLDPDAMAGFLEAREQLVASMRQPGGGALQSGARVVQLGDLGSYHHGPGGMECFARAKDYLQGFGAPAATILGNHDLEGAEFETDEENLAAWRQVFGQPHYWSVDVGPLTLIGLSTTRFRSNPDSVHEVHVDEEQLEFLERALEAARGRPVAIFTHAPIMGSGLKVVQQVHVKNRCAWLNHSSDPRRFIELVRRHPNVRLWFSGHFHLSHNYADSVSVVGRCAFVQTGVIGECHRDGFRQSRVLKGDAEGYRLYTMDHSTGAMRLDLEHRWDDPSAPVPVTPEDEIICDPSAGWLCSRVDCALDLAEAMEQQGGVKWFSAGGYCLLGQQDDILVEYDGAMMAPLGAVALKIPEGCEVVLVDAAGQEVDTVATDGSAAVAVELRLPAGQQQEQQQQPEAAGNGNGGQGAGYVVHERIERNAAGTFYQIFQPNKWRLKKEKEAREAAQRAQQEQHEAVPSA